MLLTSAASPAAVVQASLAVVDVNVGLASAPLLTSSHRPSVAMKGGCGVITAGALASDKLPAPSFRYGFRGGR
jgi:hypothetical protein